MGSDGKVVFEVDLDTKSFDAQINSLENKLDTLVQEYEALKKAKPYEGQIEDLIYYEKEIEKTSNQVINLRNQQVKTEQTSTKSWGKTLNNLKKVGLRMLGIASVYGIISKASSSYLSQNTELAEKLQSVWVALGSFLEPVLNGFSNIMLKAVGYLNEFIKALTGVDYIAKANAKAIEKQTKATKDLNKANKQTYDFDVIRTQQTASSNGTGTVSGLIDIPKLDEGVVNKLKDLAHWLRENETLVKGVGIALVATFGAIAIAKLVAGIGTLIGSASLMTGLAGLGYLLAGLATAIVITLAIKGITEAIQKAKELNETLSKNKEQLEGTKSQLNKLDESYEKFTGTTEECDEATRLYLKTLDDSTQTALNHIDAIEKDKNMVTLLFGVNKELNEEQQKNLEIVHRNNEAYKKLYDQGLLNEEQKKKYKESLEKEIEATEKLGGQVDELKKQYENIDGKTYTQTIKVDADTSQAEKKLSLLDWWKQGWDRTFGSWFGGKKEKAFASGGIVTQPTRAIIGEAGYPEAVVPMTDDYLSTLAELIGQYGGGSGNAPINIYLDGRLLQRQIANREEEVRFASNK